MFFILSKFFYFFLHPLVWIVGLLIWSFWTKNQSRKKILIRTTFALFLFFTNSFITLEFIRTWEIHGKKSTQIENYDIGIVLGGMSEYNNDLQTLSIRRGGDRIWQAIDLYKKGKIKKMLISGDNGYISDKGLHEAEQMKEILVSWGFPSEDILVEGKSINTYENAKFTAEILRTLYPNLKKKLLITSGFHMRRAKACFEKTGLVVDCYSTDLYTGPKRHYYWDQFLIPDFSNLNTWHMYNKELVGYVMYAITGKL